MTASHARLSASAAERWFNCPGSAALVAGYPRSSSLSAATGTFAHHIASECLLHAKDPADWLGNKTLVDGHEVTCDQEMVDCVRGYIEYIAAERLAGDKEFVEVDLLDALKTLHPSLGGTADYARYRASDQSVLVLDFKYGSGVAVTTEDNRQLMTYALGTLLALKVPAKTVTIAIYQPRLEVDGEVARTFTFPAMQLMEFAAQLTDAATRASAPDAPLVPGYWCRKSFCPAAKDCPKLQEHQTAIMAAEFDAVLPVDVEKLAAALAMIEPLKAKIAHLESFAYECANRGVVIPGWKLVDKRATRKWSDIDGLKAWAEENAVNVYDEPELLSPAALEKKLAKAQRPAIAAFYRKESSGTTLVPESDARPPAKLVTTDDFAALPAPSSAGKSVQELF